MYQDIYGGLAVKSKFYCNNFRKFYIQHISAIWILHLIADFCVKRKLLQFPTGIRIAISQMQRICNAGLPFLSD